MKRSKNFTAPKINKRVVGYIGLSD